MGNHSSKHKSSLSTRLADAATKNNEAYNNAYAQDNEQSQNTASSISSILINSSQQNQLRMAVQKAQNGTGNGDSPTSPLSIKTDNTSSNDDGLLSPRSPTDFEDRNQLTVTSIMSTSSAYLKHLDVDDCIHRLLESGYSTRGPKVLVLKNGEISAICRTAQEIFMSQPSLIELTPPVKIVGDVHGQYSDLIRLFEMGGFPPSSNYLFLGDYVDRGKQSLETILLLLCYKIKFPENFFLLRGNHECANVTRVYGFYDECKRRANLKLWKTFIDCFNTLPIAAVVASKIFCVHGGLSPSLHSMDEIRNITRPTDVPDYGLLNDLLWSDPSETAADWEDNERGVSYCFGKSVINEFLAKHDFDLVCRAHMVVEDGYEFFNDRTLVTVFSAPNYCGEFDNFGAIMSVSEELLCSFELLTPADHPLAKQRELEKQEKMRNAQLGKAANANPITGAAPATGSARRPSPPMIPIANANANAANTNGSKPTA